MAAKEVEISSTLEAGIKESTHVSFLCQHCYQPLKIDASIYSLDHDTLQELETPFPTLTTANSTQENKTAIDADLTDSTELVDKIPLASIGNGFDLLGEASSGVKSDNLSHRVKVSAQLFDILSGNTDIDHPLCEECTNQLLNRLDVQLHIAESELESYQDLLASMNLENDTSTQDLEEELKSLKREEEGLMKELETVEQQQKQIDQEKEEMLKQKERLTIEENRYWREYCIHQQNLLDFEDSHNSVVNQLQYAQNQLDKLRKTNVFNSTFLIWHKGHFGTINNLRLGRLPMVPVEWTEINAAWGQTVLLLYSLAKKIGMTFKRYQLVPYGNHSFVECLDDKSKELPLYGSGGFRFFWDTKFDQAMVAFLDCLQQFKEEVEKGDSNFNLPYRMEKGKIYDSTGNGAFSIKIQFNSEEHWTKALKFMLTNLKWGLAWVSSQFANNQSK